MLVFFFLLHPAACGILVPQPGIELGCLAEHGVLTTGLPGNSLTSACLPAHWTRLRLPFPAAAPHTYLNLRGRLDMYTRALTGLLEVTKMTLISLSEKGKLIGNTGHLKEPKGCWHLCDPAGARSPHSAFCPVSLSLYQLPHGPSTFPPAST